MPTTESPQARDTQAKTWVLLLLSIAASLVAAGAFLLFVTGELTPQPQPGATAAAQVVGTAASLALLWLFARASAELEHRLRADRPETQALEAAHAARQARLRQHRHRFSPAVMAVFFLFTGVTAIALVVMGIDSQSLDARSAFVQTHGARRLAVVQHVHNHYICQPIGSRPTGGYSCIPRSEIRLTTTVPVHGVRTTTVYYPLISSLRVGQRVIVLVDPHDPTYAELPGHRYRGAGGWIIFAVAAAFVALLSVSEARALTHVLAIRARHRAGPRAPAPSAAV